MKPKPIYYGKVEDNILKLNDREGFREYVQTFDGKEIELDLRKRKSERSLRQNRYYWGVVVPIFGEHWGLDREETHQLLGTTHLKKKITVEGGQEFTVVRSTTSLSTADFEEYMSKLRAWGATEFGLNIPEPNEDPNFAKRVDI